MKARFELNINGLLDRQTDIMYCQEGWKEMYIKGAKVYNEWKQTHNENLHIHEHHKTELMKKARQFMSRQQMFVEKTDTTKYENSLFDSITRITIKIPKASVKQIEVDGHKLIMYDGVMI